MIEWVNAHPLGIAGPEKHASDGPGRLLCPYWTQLATPSQASIEPEPLPLVETLCIFVHEVVHASTFAIACHCRTVSQQVYRSDRAQQS